MQPSCIDDLYLHRTLSELQGQPGHATVVFSSSQASTADDNYRSLCGSSIPHRMQVPAN